MAEIIQFDGEIPEETKLRSKCGEIKLATEEFFPLTKGRLDTRCRICAAVAAKAYREKFPEKAKVAKLLSEKKKPEVYRALNRKYVDNHKEQIAAKNAEWYKNRSDESKVTKRLWAINNPDKLNAASKRWRAKHPDRQAQSTKAWEQANPELRRKYNADRIAAKLRATPAWVNDEIMELIYAEAEYRGLEVDHIVPLRGRSVCGLHVYYNTQLLSSGENGSKSNYWPYSPRVPF